MPTQKLNVLLSTTLFPNRAEATWCVFIKKLAIELQQRCDLQISAPIPYVPKLVTLEKYEKYKSIPASDKIDGLSLLHPRYIVIPKLARSLHGMFMFASLLNAYRKIFAKNKPDVILGVWAYPDGFANLLIGKLFSIPVVISCRGSDINFLTKNKVHRRLIRWTLSRANRVLSVSEALKQEIVALGIDADHIDVVPNGIEGEKFRITSKATAHRSLGLDPQKKYVISVSRLSYEKGLDVLINAFAQLKDEQCQLLLIGGGIEKQRLQALCQQHRIQHRVIFVGDTNNEDIPQWLNAADLFVLPSRTEGWPNVLMEALACGKPVVGTRVGGIPEIIQSTHAGYLTPPEDPVAMAKAINLAFETQWDAETIRQQVVNRSWGTAAEETCHILSELLPNREIAESSLQTIPTVKKSAEPTT